MKSENALEYLHGTADEKEFLEMTDLLPLHDAITAVEIAEADRDAKAAEVFKQMCPFHDGRCRPNCKGCARLNQFIEKLNEE